MSGIITKQGRKATFIKRKDGMYEAVNRRAHIVARKNGKKTLLTLKQLRETSTRGTYRLYLYNVRGVLQPIK